jgi:hypothetical protein
MLELTTVILIFNSTVGRPFENPASDLSVEI